MAEARAEAAAGQGPPGAGGGGGGPGEAGGSGGPPGPRETTSPSSSLNGKYWQPASDSPSSAASKYPVRQRKPTQSFVPSSLIDRLRKANKNPKLPAASAKNKLLQKIKRPRGPDLNSTLPVLPSQSNRSPHTPFEAPAQRSVVGPAPKAPGGAQTVLPDPVPPPKLLNLTPSGKKAPPKAPPEETPKGPKREASADEASELETPQPPKALRLTAPPSTAPSTAAASELPPAKAKPLGPIAQVPKLPLARKLDMDALPEGDAPSSPEYRVDDPPAKRGVSFENFAAVIPATAKAEAETALPAAVPLAIASASAAAQPRPSVAARFKFAAPPTGDASSAAAPPVPPVPAQAVPPAARPVQAPPVMPVLPVAAAGQASPPAPAPAPPPGLPPASPAPTDPPQPPSPTDVELPSEPGQAEAEAIRDGARNGNRRFALVKAKDSPRSNLISVTPSPPVAAEDVKPPLPLTHPPPPQASTQPPRPISANLNPVPLNKPRATSLKGNFVRRKDGTVFLRPGKPAPRVAVAVAQPTARVPAAAAAPSPATPPQATSSALVSVEAPANDAVKQLAQNISLAAISQLLKGERVGTVEQFTLMVVRQLNVREAEAARREARMAQAVQVFRAQLDDANSRIAQLNNLIAGQNFDSLPAPPQPLRPAITAAPTSYGAVKSEVGSAIKPKPFSYKPPSRPQGLVPGRNGSFEYRAIPTVSGRGGKKPGKGKLAAGASRRPIDETHIELPEKLYECACYANKNLIYEQMGIARTPQELQRLYADRAQLSTDQVRYEIVVRTGKHSTGRGEISIPGHQIGEHMKREGEKILLVIVENEKHTCIALYQVCLVVVWDYWASEGEAMMVRGELLRIGEELEPLKRRAVETDMDMIHSDDQLGATFFAGCGWNRFQKGGGCKWNRSPQPRRFEKFADPQNDAAEHSDYSRLVYSLADKAADLMRQLLPIAYHNMAKVDGHQCRLGDRHRIFAAGSINADACLKPHKDRRDTSDGCGALLSWQMPERPTQFHYLLNTRPKDRPSATHAAIDLGFGSCTFEVAGLEVHATTPPVNANRHDPSRVSYVLFMHKGLDRPHHGFASPSPAAVPDLNSSLPTLPFLNH